MCTQTSSKANFLDSNVSVSVCFFVLICRIANVCIRACALIFLRDDFFVGVLLSHASVQMIKLKTSQLSRKSIFSRQASYNILHATRRAGLSFSLCSTIIFLLLKQKCRQCLCHF